MDVVSDKKIDKLIATQGMTRVYELEDGSWLTARDGTVAWRNNNPGNLKFGFKDSIDTPENHLPRTKEQALHSAQTSYKGVVDLDQWGNAVFESYEAGREAQKKLLVHRMGDKTIDELVKSYSTKDYSGEAHHQNQIKIIYQTAAAEGFDLHDKKVKQMSEDELNALADGVSKAESWKAGTVEKTAPLNEEQLRAALAPHTHAKEPAHSANAAQGHAHPRGLRQGDHGAAVGQLQQDLATLGVTAKDGHMIQPDQHFGQRTNEAVEAFQRDHQLTPDGIVGPATRRALDEQIQAQNAQQAPQVPTRLDDPNHPDLPLFQQAREHVHRLDQQLGRAPDQLSDNLASALVVSSRTHGLERIDQIMLSDDGSHLWATQRHPGQLGAFFASHANVPTSEVNTPMEQSGAQWPKAMEQFQLQQEQTQTRQQDQLPQQAVQQDPSAPPTMTR